MGILDDAIKEHLELKRQHGADASELKQLEDEAFGAAERPGDGDAPPDSPAEGEEATAIEHEVVPDPDTPAPPSAAEREAIAEHPTEMYEIEEELGASESRAPSDEELAEEEMDEPRLAPVDPLSGVEAEEEDEPEAEPEAEPAGEDAEPEAEPDPEPEPEPEPEADDFFDEQRLSDELDQALEAPAEQDEPVEQDEAEEEDDEAEEDVLEETPDFLEEAPEDDRLWFEQKPPKDFDFDD